MEKKKIGGIAFGVTYVLNLITWKLFVCKDKILETPKKYHKNTYIMVSGVSFLWRGFITDSYQVFILRLISIFSLITSSSPPSQYLSYRRVILYILQSLNLHHKKKWYSSISSPSTIPHAMFLYLFTVLHQCSATLFLFQGLCTVLLLGRTNCTCKCIRERTAEPCCSRTCSDQ